MYMLLYFYQIVSKLEVYLLKIANQLLQKESKHLT